MPRTCKTSPNQFCYVCGSYILKSQKCSISKNHKLIYQKYFGCPLGDQDKKWAPHYICKTCSNGFHDWLNKRRTSMPFAIPMIWREPRNHNDDCYFCAVNIKGYSAKNKHKIVYPNNIESARRPVHHDESLPIPIPPEDGHISEDEMEYTEEAAGEDKEYLNDPEYIAGMEMDQQSFSQEELNDLVRDLSLSKEKAELLASRLKEKHLLNEGVLVSHYRNRNLNLKPFFSIDGPLVYCNDINALFLGLSQTHTASDWRLFIDSSQRSLKAVLLHNGNKLPSIPVAHSVHLKETYDNMDILLETIKYKTHE